MNLFSLPLPQSLLSLPLRRRRADAPSWWAYLGSFGDDVFDDDDEDSPPIATSDAATSRSMGRVPTCSREVPGRRSYRRPVPLVCERRRCRASGRGRRGRPVIGPRLR
jgi:hypothetical protein